MPFINGIWVEPEEPRTDSIEITPSMLSLSHVQSVDSGGDWIVTMGVILFSAKYDFNQPADARRIDRVSLKKALHNSLDNYSQKYFVIQSFSSKIVRFRFLWKKWLNEALMGVSPRSHISKFEKTFSLKRKVPDLIAHNHTTYFGDFIIRKFRKMVSSRRFDRWFKGFLSRELQRKIRIHTENMFEYEYNFQTNKIIARLKTVYVLGILYAVGETIKYQRNSNKQPYVKVDFKKKVKGKANKFDRRKWETFIKRKFV